jgi:dTDP-4-amino-4,6-dideoxygalactose transaminase
LASLDEIDEQIVVNKKKYGLYVAGLRNIDGLKIVEHKESERPDYRLIVVSIGDAWPLSRDDTLRLLEAENILARPYYTPLNHRVAEYLRVCPDLPVTEAIFRDFMVLPSGAHVSGDDVEKIVGVLAIIHRHSSELKSCWKAK